MYSSSQLLQALESRQCDAPLAALYTAERLDEARARALRVTQALADAYAPGEDAPAALFSGPGRTELGGNHTDHQHGRVLCASVDMDMLACAVPNGKDVIRVLSEGYPALEISLADLSPRPQDENTSAALVRGVAEGIARRGYTPGGFDACVTSSVLSGSGLSSSAAYEILIGNIINHFFCGGELDAIELAKIGQYAENVHFGKPCGLMDQMGASVGGAVSIDFADPSNPVVEKVDLSSAGYALCIIDSGADHAELTDEYAAVPGELKEICAHFGKSVLRDVPVADFFAALPELRRTCGDRAVLRAIHVYDENNRVARQVAALRRRDFDAFLELVNASGLSSWRFLQNIVPAGYTRHQEMAFALALAERALDTAGAVRVHGGGFAGTIQAFVPLEMAKNFKAEMERVLGEGRCHILRIRSQGGCVVVA